MLISAAFPSKYLKAADIKGKEVRVVIDRVEIEEMQDGEHKPVIYFQGKEKGVVLNRTNADTLSETYSDNTDAWAGRQAILFTAKTQNPQGRTVDGIRVRVPAQQASVDKARPALKAVRQESEDPANGLSDDIPF
jgi:hypothetical protein